MGAGEALSGARAAEELEEAEAGASAAGCPPGCFTAGTPIQTEDGEKPIEQVHTGDRVLSADPGTGKQSYQTVTRTFVHPAQQVLDVETADGKRVEATPQHPFWVEGKGFTEARLLQPPGTGCSSAGRTGGDTAKGIGMGAEFDEIVRQLRSTPPACLRSFRTTAVELPGDSGGACRVRWGLACSCGADQGWFLGYPPGDYNTGYRGSECFLSPLAFECCACGQATEILDTDSHGYHAEVARLEGGTGSAKLRGEGPRQRFACPTCGVQPFRIAVEFVYWAGAFDLFVDEPELPSQEFFNDFLAMGSCATCGKEASLTRLDGV